MKMLSIVFALLMVNNANASEVGDILECQVKQTGAILEYDKDEESYKAKSGDLTISVSPTQVNGEVVVNTVIEFESLGVAVSAPNTLVKKSVPEDDNYNLVATVSVQNEVQSVFCKLK
ncbi:MAG: hypothetical protein V4596_01845 [Bdellovibrionota bacterium]